MVFVVLRCLVDTTENIKCQSGDSKQSIVFEAVLWNSSELVVKVLA